jgi:hypothetical protein
MFVDRDHYMLLTGGGIGHSNQYHLPHSASTSDISSVDAADISMEINRDESDEDGDDTELHSQAEDSEIESDEDSVAEEDEHESEEDDVNISDDGYGSA